MANEDLKSMSTEDLKKLLHTLRHEPHPHKDAARRKAVHEELKSRGVDASSDEPTTNIPSQPPTKPAT